MNIDPDYHSFMVSVLECKGEIQWRDCSCLQESPAMFALKYMNSTWNIMVLLNIVFSKAEMRKNTFCDDVR